MSQPALLGNFVQRGFNGGYASLGDAVIWLGVSYHFHAYNGLDIYEPAVQRPPSTGAATTGRPSGWALSQVDQIPAENGPGAPLRS